MRSIYLFFAAAIVSLLFICCHCSEEANVLVQNNSDKAIGCYISSYYYGENSLPENEPTIKYVKRINPGKFYYNSTIDSPNIVYIFNSDTLDKYSWKEIRDGNKYLGIYRLNNCNLKIAPDLHYRIEYPEIEKLCCDTCARL